MTNLQAGIWLISLIGGFSTIASSLERPPNTFALLFLIAGLLTIIFFIQKIHELETEIAELKKPKW